MLPDQVHLKSNIGRSLNAALAAGPNAESQQAWRERQNIDTTKQIKLVRICHVRYQHPELEKITVFLQGTRDELALINSEEGTNDDEPRLRHDHSEADGR